MTQHPKIAPFRKRTRRAKARPPARPEWLQGRAAELWDELAPELSRHGWLDPVDESGLATVCELHRQFWLLSATISKLGTEEATARGVYAAWLGIAAELRLWSDAYFLNPASRAQHGVEPKPGA